MVFKTQISCSIYLPQKLFWNSTSSRLVVTLHRRFTNFVLEQLAFKGSHICHVQKLKIK